MLAALLFIQAIFAADEIVDIVLSAERYFLFLNHSPSLASVVVFALIAAFELYYYRFSYYATSGSLLWSITSSLSNRSLHCCCMTFVYLPVYRVYHFSLELYLLALWKCCTNIVFIYIYFFYINLLFTTTFSDNTTGLYTFTCQHGDEECYWNLVEGCAINLTNNQWLKWLPFISCLVCDFSVNLSHILSLPLFII